MILRRFFSRRSSGVSFRDCFFGVVFLVCFCFRVCEFVCVCGIPASASATVFLVFSVVVWDCVCVGERECVCDCELERRGCPLFRDPPREGLRECVRGLTYDGRMVRV
jgi:hypothetical protein